MLWFDTFASVRLIEKVKFLNQSPTKISCISFFNNVGGCLASCLIFRLFQRLSLSNLADYKKTCNSTNGNKCLKGIKLRGHLISRSEKIIFRGYLILPFRDF